LEMTQKVLQFVAGVLVFASASRFLNLDLELLDTLGIFPAPLGVLPVVTRIDDRSIQIGLGVLPDPSRKLPVDQLKEQTLNDILRILPISESLAGGLKHELVMLAK